jgi:TonB family protein
VLANSRPGRLLRIGARDQAPSELAGEAASAEINSLKVEPVGARPLQAPVDRNIFWVSAGSALAIHGLVLALLALGPPPEPLSGGGGQYLEAIEVTIVRSPVIEARKTERMEIAAGASNPVAPEEGDQAKPPNPKQEIKAPVPDAEVAVVMREKAAQPEPRRAGGETARAIEADGRASGPASASPGAVQKYAAQVREALARNKPKGLGNRGTATVTFAISSSGTVSYARLSTSSGKAALDKTAIDAVLNTSFPTPPQGMTENELTYVIPFHFK